MNFDSPSSKHNTSDAPDWGQSVQHQECTLHQLSPYIGKVKSSIVHKMVNSMAPSIKTVLDPFCGSGTIALEAWMSGKHVIAGDLSPYAYTVTRGKLFPPPYLEVALKEIDRMASEVATIKTSFDLRKVPAWVRCFFHPETLRETLAWFHVCQPPKRDFYKACLLGILHHQRPGFLSYPSSHTVPYLREGKYPREQYPQMYEYRCVRERLERKVQRSLARIPELDRGVYRKCHLQDALSLRPREIDAIITSPPYMGQLDYARDNRLRLWFVGVNDHRILDRKISPSEEYFLDTLRSCFSIWKKVIRNKGLCILILGDVKVRSYNMNLQDVAIHMALKEVKGYSLISTHSDPIPDSRRVRKGLQGSKSETIITLRNERN